MRWVYSFRTTGTVDKKKPPGPKRTVTTPVNTERVRAAFLRSPRRSVRKQTRALQIARSSIRRIIFGDISNRALINQNLAPWMTLRKQLKRKFH